MNLKMNFGANESLVDSRTVNHEDIVMAGTPLMKGGVSYALNEIDNQHTVGICTAISLTQNRAKANGRKYSPDFQYLLQKKFYDGAWFEGSSILNALKVGKRYGFLPAELWTWTTEQDRLLSYSQYINKLQSIPDTEVQRLILLCVDKLIGYASVAVTNSQALAVAINGSKSGILCRYTTGNEWFTSVSGVTSWNPKDINPLRAPVIPTSGHAINMTSFDYNNGIMQLLTNTWGSVWCKQGCADINWQNYSPTEAWVLLDTAPIIPLFSFKNDLAFSMTSPDILQLQILLNKNPLTLIATSGVGSKGNETNYFGNLTLIAVKKFQSLNHIPQTGFVGVLTRTALNKLL